MSPPSFRVPPPGAALVRFAAAAAVGLAGSAWAQEPATVTLCTDRVLLERMAAMEARLVGEDLGRIRLLERHGDDRAATCAAVPADSLDLGVTVLHWTGYDQQGAETRWLAKEATGPDGAGGGWAVVPADPAESDRRW